MHNKLIVCLSPILIGLFACSGSDQQPAVPEGPRPIAPPPEPVAAEPSAQTMASLKAAVATYDAINRVDMAAIEALLAPELVRVVIKGTETDRAAYVTFLQGMMTRAPKDSTTALVTLANGDRTASLYLVDYKRGPKIIFGETGRHNAEGKFVRIEDYGDQLTMLHQMGVRPDPNAPDPEQAWPETFQIAATGSATESANVEVVKALFAADTEANADKIGELLTDDAFFRVIPEKTTGKGRPQLLDMMKRRHTVLTPSYDLTAVWGAGDWVVAEHIGRAKLKAGATAGKELTSRSLAFMRLRDGKISEIYLIYNNAPNMIALGALSEKDLEAALKKLRAWFVAYPERKK